MITLKKFITTLSIYFIGGQFLFVLLFVLLFDGVVAPNNFDLYINFGDYALMFILLVALYSSELKEEFIKFTQMKKSYLIKTIIIYFIILFGFNYLYGTYVYSGTPDNQQIINNSINNQYIMSLLTFCILGPFVEEIVFRFTIQQYFYRVNAIFSMIFTAIIFGSMHILNSLLSTGSIEWGALGIYAFLGLVFGVIYYKSKNLFVGYTCHLLNNLLSLLVTLLFIIK